ncbi:hypothetical protein ACXKGW_29045, partial [Klebsiella pneumoniae subsp. pneumoniae]
LRLPPLLEKQPRHEHYFHRHGVADHHPARRTGFDATRIPGVRLMRAEQAYPRSPVFYEPRICILGGVAADL